MAPERAGDDLQVIVVGPGAVGGAIAVRSSGPGTVVRVVARGTTADSIVEHGIELQAHDGGRLVATPAVLTQAAVDALDPPDVVIVCVKTRDTTGILEMLDRVVTPSTAVVCLQNGITNDRTIAARIGWDRLVPGVVYVGAGRTEANVIVERTVPRIELGTHDGRPLPEAVLRLAGGWRERGARVELRDDILTAKWQKFLFNAALNPLTALTGRRLGSIMADAGGRELFLRLVDDAIKVAHADGASLWPDARERVLAVAGSMDISSSMAEDLEAGRPLEREAFGGFVRTLAARHGIATPATDAVDQLLGVVDPGRPSQSIHDG